MSRILLRIGQRIGAGYLALFLLIVVLGIAGVVSVRLAASATEGLYLHPFAVTNSMSDFRRDLLLANMRILDGVAYPQSISSNWTAQTAQLAGEADAALALAGERYLGPRADFHDLEDEWGRWKAVQGDVANAIAAGDSVQLRALYAGSVRPQFDKTLAATDVMLTFARARGSAFYADSQAARRQAFNQVIDLFIAILVLGGGIGYWVTRSITTPLSRLQRDMDQLSRGNLDITIGEVERIDEIGGMARQVEIFRQTAVAKQRTELKFATIFRNSPDVILLSDKQSGVIIEANDAFERVFGFTKQDAIGRSSLALHAWANDAERERLLRALDGVPRLLNFEVTFCRQTGELFPALLSVEPLDMDGRQILLISARDISDRKRDEEDLRQMVERLAASNLELERFAQVAAHDLQEPSRIICSYAQMLERRYGDTYDAEGREFLAYLIGGANRMRDLVRGLSVYSTSGSRAVTFAPVAFADLVEAVSAELATPIAASGAKIEAASELPVVLGDRTQLHQLLSHLVGNALKFQPERQVPVIRIASTREGAEWHLVVGDNGIGIPKEFADRVFEIFRRLHGQGRYPGSGLGLAVCKRIVEAHGGRIWLRSEMDQGCEIHFTLPVAPQ